MSGMASLGAGVRDCELLGCRNCGSTKLAAWYKVEERQGIERFIDQDGNVQIGYDGNTKTGETGPDEEYVCLDCEETALTVEVLVGRASKDEPDDDRA